MTMKSEERKKRIGRPPCAEELAPISIKIDASILSRVDAYWEGNGYRSRNAMVTDAIRMCLDGVKCSVCGAVNPKGGRICSVCLHPLTDELRVNTNVTIEKK